MGKTLFKWSCYLTAGFAFIWVAAIWSHYSNWYSVAGFVLLGIFFYVGTFLWGLGVILRLTMWICALLWSTAVFVVFAISAQVAMSTNPSTFSGAPVWMQVSSPFVYATAPLLILWGTRVATVYLDK
jgi:hypothetical protein